MNFKRFLSEEWKHSFKKWTSTIDIFKNPSLSEMKYVDNIRAFLTEDDFIYAWSGYTPAFHMDVEEELDNMSFKNSIPIYVFKDDNTERMEVNISMSYKTYSKEIKSKLVDRVVKSKTLKKLIFPNSVTEEDIEFGDPN
jgi:hypothetical protein